MKIIPIIIMIFTTVILSACISVTIENPVVDMNSLNGVTGFIADVCNATNGTWDTSNNECTGSSEYICSQFAGVYEDNSCSLTKPQYYASNDVIIVRGFSKNLGNPIDHYLDSNNKLFIITDTQIFELENGKWIVSDGLSTEQVEKYEASYASYSGAVTGPYGDKGTSEQPVCGWKKGTCKVGTPSGLREGEEEGTIAIRDEQGNKIADQNVYNFVYDWTCTEDTQTSSCSKLRIKWSLIPPGGISYRLRFE